MGWGTPRAQGWVHSVIVYCSPPLPPMSVLKQSGLRQEVHKAECWQARGWGSRGRDQKPATASQGPKLQADLTPITWSTPPRIFARSSLLGDKLVPGSRLPREHR